MIYVALLRGINVGGNNKIAMKELKESFEKAGMNNVTTYINTGNIIFTSKKKKEQLTKILEKTIHKDFKLTIKVLVKTLKDFERIMKKMPKNWSNDKDMKSDVLFLWESLKKEELPIKNKIDTVIILPDAVLWSVKRKNLTKSGMMQLAKENIYKHMTIRNVNTFRKLYELVKKQS